MWSKSMYNHCIVVFICLVAVDQVLAGVAKNPNKGLALGELRCYECASLVDGDRCEKLDNHSRTLQCPADHPFCMTKRFSYSLNAPKVQLWYIERNCSQYCEEYCITMGERVKIFACTSCCNEDLCNVGNGQPNTIKNDRFFYSLIFSVWAVCSILFQF